MRFFTTGILLLLFFSCSSDSKTKHGIINSVDSSYTKLDTAHVFVLAAPLQIATLIKINCPNPEMELLCADSNSTSSYVTNYKRGLNLGICITDIGYCALYGKNEDALHYLTKAKKLIHRLYLDNLGDSFINRLEMNIGKPDSMSKILLTLSNLAQKQLNESGNEKIAFYITAGSFLEGMALSMGNNQVRKSNSFPQIVGQEKLWLKNFLDAIVFLKPDNDTQDLYNTFYTLQHYAEPIKVNSEKGIPSAIFTETDINLLQKKIIQLRNEASKP